MIGAGAIGASVAAELHRAGVRTLLIARGAHLAALRAGGLRYVRPDGAHVLPVPTAAGPDEVALRPDDVLVLATKSQDTEAAVREWAWRPVGGVGPAAGVLPLLTLQNGVENERVALRRFAHVLGGMIRIPGTYLNPGEVINPGTPVPGLIWLGAYPHGEHPRAAEVAADLRRGGFGVQVVQDIARWKATKLLGNLNNALDALYPPSPLRTAAVDALRAEARTVLAAAGADPADHATESTLDGEGFGRADIPGYPRGGSSTWQSLTRAGTPETDYLNGEIVLLARLHGVAAPLNAAVQERLHRAVADGIPARGLDDADLAATFPGVRG